MVDRRADRPAQTAVAYVRDTQLGKFRGRASQATGQISLDSQSPARVQIAVSVTPQERRPDNAAAGDASDDTRRFSLVTLVAREFRLAAEAGGARGMGVLASTLEFNGVKRPLNIPIVFALDGAVLQGQGCFPMDLTDFGMAPPRRHRLEAPNVIIITIEVYLLVSSRASGSDQAANL